MLSTVNGSFGSVGGMALCLVLSGSLAFALPPKIDLTAAASAAADAVDSARSSSTSSFSSSPMSTRSEDDVSDGFILARLAELFRHKLKDERLAQALAKEVVKLAPVISMPTKMRLFRKGDDVDYVYFLLTGAILIERDGITKARIESPSIVGESGAIENDKRSADALCLSGACILQLPRSEFERLLLESGAFRRFLISLLSDRLSLSNERIKRQSERGSDQQENVGLPPAIEESRFKQVRSTFLAGYEDEIRASLLGPISLEELAKACKVAVLDTKSAQLVFAQGANESDVYLVLEGSVVISVRNGDVSLVVAEKKAGNHFGEMGAYQARTASVITRQGVKTVLLRIRGDSFDRLARKYPEIEISLLKGLVGCLKQNNTKGEFERIEWQSGGFANLAHQSSGLARILKLGKRASASSESNNVPWVIDAKEAFSTIHRISISQTVRSLMATPGVVIPNKITINGVTFYDAKDAPQFETQEAFFVAWLQRLKDAGMEMADSDDALQGEVRDFLGMIDKGEQAEAAFNSLFGRRWHDVLRLSSFSSFIQADLTLREAYPDLFAEPWRFVRQQGVEVHIQIQEDKSIIVTQCVSSFVTKSDGEGGRKTLAQIPYSWTLRMSGESVAGAIYSRKQLEMVGDVSKEDRRYIENAFKPTIRSARSSLSNSAGSVRADTPRRPPSPEVVEQQRALGIDDYNAIRDRFANLPSYEEMRTQAANAIDRTTEAGNCLIDNVAFQLGLSFEERDVLRLQIADYMAVHREDFEAHFREGTHHLRVADGGDVIAYDDINGYIDAIRQPLVWGDEPMLAALAALTDRPVIVFSEDYLRGIVIYNANGRAEPIILYARNHNHFTTAGTPAYWQRRLQGLPVLPVVIAAAAAAAPVVPSDVLLSTQARPHSTKRLSSTLLHLYGEALPSPR